MAKARAVDIKNVNIRWLTIGLLISVVLNIFQFVKMANLPNDFQVNIPPDLSVGGVQKVNTTPNYAVYSFAYRIFQKSESCLDSCGKDAVENIKRHRNFMSPRHYRKRLAEAQEKSDRLSSTTRTITEFGGYESSSVKKISPGVWEVTLKLEYRDWIGDNPLASKGVERVVRVIASDIDLNKNPWRLKLDLFKGVARRIEGI